MEINNIIDIGNNLKNIIISIVIGFSTLIIISSIISLISFMKYRKNTESEVCKKNMAISSKILFILSIAFCVIFLLANLTLSFIASKKKDKFISLAEDYLGETITSDISNEDIDNFINKGYYLEITTNRLVKNDDSSLNSNLDSNLDSNDSLDNDTTLSSNSNKNSEEIYSSSQGDINSSNENNITDSKEYTKDTSISDDNSVDKDILNNKVGHDMSSGSLENKPSSFKTIENHYIICNRNNFIEFYKELYENYYQKIYKED